MTNIFIVSAFQRDVKKIKDKAYENIIKKILIEVRENGLDSILSFPEVVNIARIQGYQEQYYRIKIKYGVGFRIGIEITDEGIYLLRTDKRKDFYKRFPS